MPPLAAQDQKKENLSVKICVLVKEVPDAAVEKRMDSGSKRLDRSGEKNLNPFDTHAIEAAMQIREGGAVEVDEVVAVTMGPESAFRALHKAVSLGADRSVHLTDEALSGSDVCATGYALAKVLESESPDLVLLGQQSDDGECYTIGAVVADHLRMPSLTQVIKIDVTTGSLRCERQAEYGYAADAGIDPTKVGRENAPAHWTAAKEPPKKAPGEIIEDDDTDATVERIVSW